MAITPNAQGSDFLARNGSTVSLALRAESGVAVRLRGMDLDQLFR